MNMYHGTLLADALAIKESGILPEINIKNELDFGYGFYLGRKLYARSIAKKKLRLKQAEGAQDAVGVIVKYSVDLKRLKKAFGKKFYFVMKTRACLLLYFNCRLHKGERYLNTAYVYAPLADGNVDDVMDWYLLKPSVFRKAIALFNYWLPSGGKQLVLKTTDACKCVHMVKIVTLKGEVVWEES